MGNGYLKMKKKDDSDFYYSIIHFGSSGILLKKDCFTLKTGLNKRFCRNDAQR